MAGGPSDLFDLEDDRIAVTVDQNLPDELDVAGLLPLAPQSVAATRKIDRPAGGERLLPRLAVDVSHHQNGAVVRILRNCRNQSAGLFKIKFDHLAPQNQFRR